MQHGELPARALAKTLAVVHRHAGAPLPTISGLPEGGQVACEEENVRRSFANARERLAL